MLDNINFDEIYRNVSDKVCSKLNKDVPENLDKTEIDYIKNVIVNLALHISIEAIKEYDKMKNY